jgi:AcrR family transcriptional regulator
MSLKKENSDQSKPGIVEAARRAQIIECAIETIAETGFVEASLARIAQQAGVSTGVISYYFDGRDALMRAMAAHVLTTVQVFIQPRVDLSRGPRAALQSALAAFVGATAAYPKHLVALWKIAMAGRLDLYPTDYRPMENARSRAFRNILEWGQREGTFRAFDMVSMVGAIIGALDSILMRLNAGQQFDVEAAGRELAEIFDRATRSDQT